MCLLGCKRSHSANALKCRYCLFPSTFALEFSFLLAPGRWDILGQNAFSISRYLGRFLSLFSKCLFKCLFKGVVLWKLLPTPKTPFFSFFKTLWETWPHSLRLFSILNSYLIFRMFNNMNWASRSNFIWCCKNTDGKSRSPKYAKDSYQMDKFHLRNTRTELANASPYCCQRFQCSLGLDSNFK